MVQDLQDTQQSKRCLSCEKSKKSNRHRQMGKQTSNLFLVCASFLLTLAVFSGVVFAGSIVIDVEGIASVPVGSTVHVPVKVVGATSFSGYQLTVNTGVDANADVLFNKTMSTSYVSDSNDTTGAVYWAGFTNSVLIDGSHTLFYLDVTPKNTGAIPLTLYVEAAFEGHSPSLPVNSYNGVNAMLVAVDSGDSPTPTTPTPTTPAPTTPTPTTPTPTTPTPTTPTPTTPTPTTPTPTTPTPTTPAPPVGPVGPSSPVAPPSSLPSQTQEVSSQTDLLESPTSPTQGMDQLQSTGNDDFVDEVSVTTNVSVVHDNESMILIPAIIGGVCAAILIAVIIVILVIRRRRD